MTKSFKGEIKQGTYVCDGCGKTTRETNPDAAAVNMCSACYEENLNENEESDNIK